MIKIAFVSINSYPLFNPAVERTFGGSEVQVYLLSKELVKDKEFQVSVIVGDFGQNDEEDFDRVKVHKAYSVRKTGFNYLKAPFILLSKLKQINPDVVIQRSASPETGTCAYYCRNNQKKFVYSIAHEIDVSGEFFSRGIFGRMFYYGINRADFLIAQNQEQVNLLRKSDLVSKSNVRLIKNGFPIEVKDGKKREYVLWVGRSDAWKRPKLFLDIAREFKGEQFIMIIPESSDAAIWQKIKQDKIHIPNLHIRTKIPFSEIQSVFDCAKVFVSTSKYEGFPNTFIQSCLGKVPILSLKVNPDNFLNKYQCGFACQDDFNLLIMKLNSLLNNNGLRRQMGERAFTYVKENHDIKKIVNEWKNLLREVGQNL